MQLATKTGLFAAGAACVTAGGLIILLYGWFELPALLMATLGFGVLAAAVSFVVVFFTVSRHIGRFLPVLGAARGAALAVLTFMLCLIPHAVIFSGSGGFVPSLIGQFVLGLVLFGWLVAIVGALVGYATDRVFFSAPAVEFNTNTQNRHAG